MDAALVPRRLGCAILPARMNKPISRCTIRAPAPTTDRAEQGWQINVRWVIASHLTTVCIAADQSLAFDLTAMRCNRPTAATCTPRVNAINYERSRSIPEKTSSACVSSVLRAPSTLWWMFLDPRWLTHSDISSNAALKAVWFIINSSKVSAAMAAFSSM